MAEEFGAVLVPCDSHFNALAATMSMVDLAEDGIHPTVFGHQVLARLWLATVALA
jgi:lysophospholipase L1-like esterase